MLSTLLRSRVTGEPNIVMAERLADEKNDFRGIAQAVIEPRYFFDFYAQVAAGGEIILTRDDGAIVLRYPQLPDAAALSLRMPGTNLAPDYVSPADGVSRLAGIAPVTGYPLAATVGLDLSTVLQDWRRETLLQGIYAAIACIALATLGIAAFLRANRDRHYRIGLEAGIRERTAQLERAIAARDMLLQELNLRLKNNLQMVNSLLRLGASRIDDPRVHGLVRECGERILAMADVHTSLYQSDVIGSLEVGSFLRELCQRLAASFAEPRHRAATLTVDASLLWLDADRAIVLGLIANELVTNCFKHALVQTGCAIRVLLQPGDEAMWCLEVGDDGPGAGDGGNEGEGIGMRLVDSLARQLGGSMTVERSPGFRVRVTFPEQSVEVEAGQLHE